MNLQPSASYDVNERRILFANELALGGHGQVYLSGAGTFDSPTGHTFYAVDFLEDTVIASVVFKTQNDAGDTIYEADDSEFVNAAFPAGYTWVAPLTSIEVTSGSGIAYLYRDFVLETDPVY